MIEQEIQVINKLGLHARASAKLVNTAGRFGSAITVEFAGQQADAKSIMAVMMLAASQGSMISIRCDGEDEHDALQALCDLINRYFDEDE